MPKDEMVADLEAQTYLRLRAVERHLELHIGYVVNWEVLGELEVFHCKHVNWELKEVQNVHTESAQVRLLPMVIQ